MANASQRASGLRGQTGGQDAVEGRGLTVGSAAEGSKLRGAEGYLQSASSRLWRPWSGCNRLESGARPRENGAGNRAGFQLAKGHPPLHRMRQAETAHSTSHPHATGSGTAGLFAISWQPEAPLAASTATSVRCLLFIPNPWYDVHHVHELHTRGCSCRYDLFRCQSHAQTVRRRRNSRRGCSMSDQAARAAHAFARSGGPPWLLTPPLGLRSRPGPTRWKATDTQHPDNSMGFLELQGDHQRRHDEDTVGS
jgi:hypothetical protein